MRTSTKVNLTLVAAAFLLAAVSWVVGMNAAAGQDEPFAGSDSTATSVIEESNPSYTPWFEPLWEPGSGEIESGIFAFQAAAGAGVLGYLLGVLRTRRTYEHRQGAATTQPAPAATP